MRKHNKGGVLSTGLLAVVATTLAIFGCVRHTVHPVVLEGKTHQPPVKDGIFYSLPRTLVQVVIRVQQTRYVPGPYVAKAQEVGVLLPFELPAPLRPVSVYKLLATEVNARPIPDPENCFLVEVQDRWSQSTDLLVTLDAAGLIVSGKSAGHDRTLDYVVKTIEAAAKLAAATAGVVPTPPTAFAGATIPERYAAALAAMRKTRTELLGYKDLKVSAEVLAKQLEALDEEERRLLAAFYTREITEQMWSFEVDPQDGTRFRLCKFSGTVGVTSPEPVVVTEGEKSGIILTVEKKPDAQFSDRVRAVAGTDLDRRRSFFYRIPAVAKANVFLNSKKLLGHDLLVSQLGAVAALPDHAGSVKSKLEVKYHAGSGALSEVGWVTTAPDPANIEAIGNAAAAAVAAYAARESTDESGNDKVASQLETIGKLIEVLGAAQGLTTVPAPEP